MESFGTGARKAANGRLLFALWAALIVMVPQSLPGQWKLHPAVQEAVEKIKVGETTSIRGSDRIVGATDLQARQEYLKSIKANDKDGIRELRDAGKIAMIETGIVLRVLERNDDAIHKLMDDVHKLLDIDVQAYKACLNRNVERARRSLRLETCSLDFDSDYDFRLRFVLENRSPADFVDSSVLVLVRLPGSGEETGKKLWVMFGDLKKPSIDDANQGLR